MRAFSVALAVLAAAGCATRPNPVQPTDPVAARLSECIGVAEIWRLSVPLRDPTHVRMMRNKANWQLLLLKKEPDEKLYGQYLVWGFDSAAQYARGAEITNSLGKRAEMLANCEREFGAPESIEAPNG